MISTLGAPKKDCHLGVDFMATEEAPSAKDVMLIPEIGTAVLSLTDKRVKELADHPAVAGVEEDFEVEALEPCCCNGGEGMSAAVDDCDSGEAAEEDQVEPAGNSVAAAAAADPEIGWNIRLVKANRVWRRTTGCRVKVAVLDTGIAPHHSDITVHGGACFVPGVTSWADGHGHGTHCAGIIGAKRDGRGVVGVAPDCHLYAVKVLSDSGSGMWSWILAGMGWALRHNMDVVSMSLGAVVPAPDTPCSASAQAAGHALVTAGCNVIAAAGNSEGGSAPWVNNPARCPAFMAVGAVDSAKLIASFSSNGPASLCDECGVEICAPGVKVKSTIPGNKYTEMSGTSMATPHVAGAAALLKELRPTWGAPQVRKRLRNTADDLGVPGKDVKYGSGLLNCFRAVYD